MGDIYRQKHAGRPAELATPAQIAYLRGLCLECDGEVDEDWLYTLSKFQASQEIDRRKSPSETPWRSPTRKFSW